MDLMQKGSATWLVKESEAFGCYGFDAKRLNHVALSWRKFQSDTEISSRRLLQLSLSCKWEPLFQPLIIWRVQVRLTGAGVAGLLVNFPVLKLPSAQSIDQTAGSNDENSRIEPKLTLAF